jgi:lysophospholipase L1-like esterase
MPNRTTGSARSGSARSRSARVPLVRGGLLAALLAVGVLLLGLSPASAAPAAARPAAPEKTAPAKAATPGWHAPARPVYYVALGDSLAQGVQPATAPLPPGVALGQSIETDAGYADDLYAHYQRQFGGALTLVKLITIDIGANDVDGCATATTINQTCVTAGLASVGHNLPLILGALRDAAGRRAVIAGMNLYDPFLADYLTGAAGQTLATASVSLDESLNQLIDGGYQAFGVRTADVQDAFSTTDFTDTAPLPGVGTVPLNVARICGWTWMCAPAPVGQNIHANATGYQRIAAAFEQAIGCLGRRGR